jgi:hypothetical protein
VYGISLATKRCYGSGEFWLLSDEPGQDKGIIWQIEPSVKLVYHNDTFTLCREQNRRFLFFHEYSNSGLSNFKIIRGPNLL